MLWPACLGGRPAPSRYGRLLALDQGNGFRRAGETILPAPLRASRTRPRIASHSTTAAGAITASAAAGWVRASQERPAPATLSIVLIIGCRVPRLATLAPRRTLARRVCRARVAGTPPARIAARAIQCSGAAGPS